MDHIHGNLDLHRGCRCLQVGHRVKTHKVTPATGNERGDIEIKDYVTLPRGEDNRLPPHTLSHTECPPDPEPDGALKNAAKIKIRHYRQLYTDKSDPIVFLPVT